MIYILTQEDIVTVDHQNEWKEQLKVINEIRREIMQSSSGILKGNEFQDVMENISKVCQFTCFVDILSIDFLLLKK